jgi:hypothetical protein
VSSLKQSACKTTLSRPNAGKIVLAGGWKPSPSPLSISPQFHYITAAGCGKNTKITKAYAFTDLGTATKKKTAHLFLSSPANVLSS